MADLGAVWALVAEGASAAEPSGYPTTALGALIVALLLVLGAGGWLMRHVFTVTLPALNATFERALDKVIAHHDVQNAARDAREASESKAIVQALQEQGEALQELKDSLAAIAASMPRRRPPRPPPPGGTNQ